MLIADVVKKLAVNRRSSSGIHIGLTKALQLWKINHGNDFEKLAETPENNCSQKELIRNLCGPMRH